MTVKITESAIEEYALEILTNQGFEYIHGSEIAPDSDSPERNSFEEVILSGRLKKTVHRINKNLPHETIDAALKQINRLNSTELIVNNETFHRLLTEEINISVQKDSYTRGDYVKLIDFDEPDNNEFLAVSQFTVTSTGSVTGAVNKRPDIILFVNGIPLVVIELKNPSEDNATVHSAFRQIQTYKETIPAFFTYKAFCAAFFNVC